MKICIFNNEPIETAGGAGTASFSIAKELAKSGEDVHYIVKSLGEYHEYENSGVSIYCTRSSSYRKIPIIPITIHRFLIYSFQSIIESQQLINKIKPDVFLSFGPYPSIHQFVYNLTHKKSIPYIISFRHNPLLRKTPFIPKNAKWTWKFNPLIRHATAFTSPSYRLSKDVEPHIRRKINTIPNGIDSAIYYPNDTVNIDDKLSHPIILCLSRLAPEKRVEDAILAMPKILEKYPQIILHIVGDGIEREKLTALVEKLNISKSVEFIGHISHDKVTDQYHAASIFLLPSDDEGFPNTFLEAITCGLPVVTTPVGDLEKIVPDARNGILINFQSPDEIADAICTICSDKEQYRLYSKKSLELSKNYSWCRVGKEYQQLFYDICKYK